MQKKNKKPLLSNRVRERLAFVLGGAGFVAMLLSAGTDDYRFSSEYNPETDKIASVETTTAMALGGSAAMLGAVILLAGRKKDETR